MPPWAPIGALLLGAPVAMGGCATKSKPGAQPGAPNQARANPKPGGSNDAGADPARPEPLDLATRSGTTTVYSSEPRIPLWKVSWKSAQGNMDPQKSLTRIQMNQIEGEAYQQGKLVAVFKAGGGESDATEQKLTMNNQVEIRSDREGRVLKANRIVWDPKAGLYRASGSVTVETPEGAIGPVETMIVSAKMDKVGTREEFFRK